MLQVARLAPRLLGESAPLVKGFLHSQMNADGAFANRAGESDLYYTVFGLEALMAVGGPIAPAAVAAYLQTFGDGQGLDLVHLACLARCWANVPAELRSEGLAHRVLSRIERHRSADGGYNASPAARSGTVYGCFLAVGAHQDLQVSIPQPDGILRCLESLRAEDGGFANQQDLPLGLTPATAAAASLLRQLGQPPRPELGQWLLSRCHERGGFFATPLAPIPDLLSTATALHALAAMHVSFEPIKEPCLDFLDTLWTNQGGFYGSWTDDKLDCEYTYYGLLALGHLGV